MTRLNRRAWLQATSSSVIVLALPLRAFEREDTLTFATWARDTFGKMPVEDHRVAITLPALAENGNSVALRVDVEHPMAETDYVRTIDVFAPANPVPHLARFNLSPYSGQATVSTRIRLAGDQVVHAVATLSNGECISSGAKIVVTEAACLDFLI